MKIWKYTYNLKPIKKLNNLTEIEQREGCLLKFDFGEGDIGYCDCHPWIEFGDVSLAQQLELLAKNEYTAITQQCLIQSRLDAQARKQKHDLLAGAFSLENHYLISDFLNFNLEELEKVKEAGFKFVKIKMGTDILAESQKLIELKEKYDKGFLLRLDFNKVLDERELQQWLDGYFIQLSDCIDFIEDPCEYSMFWSEIKENYNLRLALDHFNFNSFAGNLIGVDVVVLKPARQNVVETLKLLKGQKLEYVVTHNMGHTLERASAVATAMKAKFILKDRLVTCGLLAGNCYANDEFTDLLPERGPFVIPMDDIGLGFSDKLNNLNWELVCD